MLTSCLFSSLLHMSALINGFPSNLAAFPRTNHVIVVFIIFILSKMENIQQFSKNITLLTVLLRLRTRTCDDLTDCGQATSHTRRVDSVHVEKKQYHGSRESRVLVFMSF